MAIVAPVLGLAGPKSHISNQIKHQEFQVIAYLNFWGLGLLYRSENTVTTQQVVRFLIHLGFLGDEERFRMGPVYRF